MRSFIHTLALVVIIALGSISGVRGEPADGFGKSDWTKWIKSNSKEVSCRYVCDGYDHSARCYKMRFAFRNDAAVALNITYQGKNTDGSQYKENQYLEAGEEAEKECQGTRPTIAPCKILSTERIKTSQ